MFFWISSIIQKKTDSEQIRIKNNFNDLINHSLKDIAQNDRIILDTGDGAAIAYMGSPEDALFMAISIRDGILKGNTQNSTPLYVRFGSQAQVAMSQCH